MNLHHNEKEALAQLKRSLEQRIGSVDLWLFGSKAKGLDLQESDVDIMIVVERNTFEFQSIIDDLVFEINLAYDCFISVVVFGRDELEIGPLSESPLYRAVMDEGLRI